MEALKSPLLKPGDMGPAVKIWAWDYHPCSKHCVFVCQRLILLLMSHLYILSQHPPPCFCAQIHSVRSDSVERGLHVFMWIPSASHGLSGQQCVYIYLESSAWILQNALRATRTFFFFFKKGRDKQNWQLLFQNRISVCSISNYILPQRRPLHLKAKHLPVEILVHVKGL